MKLAVGARPIPGTTELLEVLDRVLDGGLVIDSGPRLHVIGFSAPGTVTRLVVPSGEALLPQAADGDGRANGRPLPEQRPAELPRRRHG